MGQVIQPERALLVNYVRRNVSDKQSTPITEGEAEVLMAIAAMNEPDRTIGKRLHSLVKENAPMLVPRTWYGMPAYADGGKVICFFRGRQKFGERYMSFGFNDVARLDEGTMWPVMFAITDLTSKQEAVLAALLRKAVG